MLEKAHTHTPELNKQNRKNKKKEENRRKKNININWTLIRLIELKTFSITHMGEKNCHISGQYGQWLVMENVCRFSASHMHTYKAIQIIVK